MADSSATPRAQNKQPPFQRREAAVYNRLDEMSRTKTLAKTRAQALKRPNPKKRPKTGPLLSGKKLITTLCLLLAAATIALYSPVMGHSFVVLDDREYVVANSHIHDGLSWKTVKWAFTSMEAANWHPLTWLSHALDYQLFAMNPGGHHLDSVLIHALNAALLFLGLTWITKRVGPSLLVASLFALHPINVESVAWVAERKNVLSTLFFFFGDRCLCLVRPKAGLAPLPADGRDVCRELDGQADGRHAALRLIAVGLLAAGENVVW